MPSRNSILPSLVRLKRGWRSQEWNLRRLPYLNSVQIARKRQYGARCVLNPREHLYHGMRTLNNAQTKMLLTDLGRAPKILAMQEDVKVGSVVFWGSHQVLPGGWSQMALAWQVPGSRPISPHYSSCIAYMCSFMLLMFFFYSLFFACFICLLLF